MWRCSIATIVSPLASKRDRISPTSPRRTVSGLSRTSVRDMRRTLSTELSGPRSDVVRDGRGRQRVGLDLPGDGPQRQHPGPDARLDVLGLVADALGAQLERRLVEGYGEHRGRGQLLAGVRAQGGGAPGHDLVDHQVEGAGPL